MSIDDRLARAGISLPEPPPAVGSYVPTVLVDGWCWVSGMLPLRDGSLVNPGILGASVSLEEGREAAVVAAVVLLARLAKDLGSLERIEQWVSLTGYVASTPDFHEQPQVMNAASDLIAELFGERGRHTRAAVGVASLPLGAPVEIAAVVRVA
jgi:enamine deaminase RidA (YjgF/YER057c/UK114 family)